MNTGIEWQVSNLEWSKRLKELGVKQESYFYWVFIEILDRVFDTGEVIGKHIEWILQEGYGKGIEISNGISAFTVAELFDSVIKDSNIEWKIFHSKNGCMIYPAGTPGYTMELPTFTSLKLADMLAELKVYLIEKGIVKP